MNDIHFTLSSPKGQILSIDRGNAKITPQVEIVYDVDFTPLEDGVVLQSSCLNLPEAKEYQFTVENSPLTIAFCVEGRAEIEIDFNGCAQTKLNHSPAMFTIGKLNKAYGFWKPAPGNCRMVDIVIPSSLAESLWREYHDYLPRMLTPARDGDALPEFFVSVATTPELMQAVNSLVSRPVRGLGESLYLECKSQEIILLLMSHLSSKQPPIGNRIPLFQSDIDRIYEARELLERNMESPPSLVRLAQLTGINEFKLKKGFRQIFGTTPYRHLRSIRLETARKYLESGEMNVCEACLAVGYSNLGNFISLFRKRYGITPGSLLRSSLRSARHRISN